jgi:hypothetical protein
MIALLGELAVIRHRVKWPALALSLKLHDLAGVAQCADGGPDLVWFLTRQTVDQFGEGMRRGAGCVERTYVKSSSSFAPSPLREAKPCVRCNNVLGRLPDTFLLIYLEHYFLIVLFQS